MIAEELTPEARDEAIRAARLAAMKAAAPKYREAFKKARARRQQAELAAFFDDGADESHELGAVVEFEDLGGDE